MLNIALQNWDQIGKETKTNTTLLKRLNVFCGLRCMFGSDWPVCRLAKNTDYPDVLELLQKLTNHLPYEDRKNIFRNTVVNYYGLNE